jgi:hypothetical protein
VDKQLKRFNRRVKLVGLSPKLKILFRLFGATFLMSCKK